MGDFIESSGGPARFTKSADNAEFRHRIYTTLINPQPTQAACKAAFWQCVTALTCVMASFAGLFGAVAAEIPAELIHLNLALAALTWCVYLTGIIMFNYPRGKRQHVISCLIYMALATAPMLGSLYLPSMAWIKALAALVFLLSLSAFPLIVYTKKHMYGSRS